MASGLAGFGRTPASPGPAGHQAVAGKGDIAEHWGRPHSRAHCLDLVQALPPANRLPNVHSSLFRRVTRYSVASSLDPSENRLTEVTAAVLEQVDGLAQAVAASLLGAGAEDALRRGLTEGEIARRDSLLRLVRGPAADRVDVRTQVTTSHGGFVDLEILLRPKVGSTEPGLLVWVEVKHGADLHGNQLDAYVRDIASRPVPDYVERVVVLLGPRGWAPDQDQVPPDVVMADWQGVGRLMSAAADAVSYPAEQHWLLTEYVRYLKEEGLTDPDALTAASALALMEFHAAGAAVAGICEHADALLQDDWGDRGAHQTVGRAKPAPAFGRGYWANRDTHRRGGTGSPTWRGAWFEWGLRDTSQMYYFDDARGSWAFMAGATLITRDNPTKLEDNHEWLAARLADGFHYFGLDDYYRLARLRYPDEVLAKTTLQDQGRELGRWAFDAFAALEKDPPPT